MSKGPPRRKTGAGGGETADVLALLAALDHPLKPEIEAVRACILGASAEISESVKWNSPSFRTREFFATLHLRSLDTLQVVLHRGAKKRDNTDAAIELTAPAGMVRWLASDRCIVTLGKGKELKANLPALRAIVREWIRYV